MKQPLFKKWGLLYLPTSIIGVALYAAVLYFCATVCLAANRNTHSVSDFLYGIFPYIVSAFTLLYWIAANTSGGNSTKKHK